MNADKRIAFRAEKSTKKYFFFIHIPKSVIVIPPVNRWNNLGDGYTHVWRHFMFVAKNEFLILSHGKYGSGVRCCHSFLRQEKIISKKRSKLKNAYFCIDSALYVIFSKSYGITHRRFLVRKNNNIEIVWLL